MPKNPVIDFTNLQYVFLDRDGVLNRKAPPAQYITRPEELVILPGVEEAVAALNRSGRKVIVVTNQRGIALGLYSRDDLDRIHDKLRAQLAARGGHLDAIYVCPHEAGQCNCRKPLTGLFERAYLDFLEATPESSVMVGDSLRDIEGGLRAGMATVLITGESTNSADDLRARSLAQLLAPSLSELVQQHFSSRIGD
jgi:D-glycero-D-manno-heptose 1,7-bisphosphate phosphatase